MDDVMVICLGCSVEFQEMHCIKCEKCGSLRCWKESNGKRCDVCDDSGD